MKTTPTLDTPIAGPAAAGGHLGGHAAQLSAVTLQASMLVVHGMLVASWSPWLLTGVQFGLAALTGWMLVLVLLGRPPRGFPLGRALLFGAIAPGGALTLSAVALTMTDIVSVTVIWGLAPLLVPLAGRLLLKERLQPMAYAGAIIGFVLVAWLVTQRQTTGEGDFTGNLLVVAAILCATASQILGRAINVGGGFPFPYVAVAQLTGAAVVSIAAAGVAAAINERHFILTASSSDLLLMGYLVLFCSLLNFMAYNFALKHLPVAFVSLYFTLIPAIGTLLGVVFLKVSISLEQAFVVCGIVASVALPSFARIRKARSDRSGGPIRRG